jgi:hypothetical protein
VKGPPRKLSDFTDLTKAEEQLLAECGTGEIVIISDGTRPGAQAGPDRQIRAEMIRYLLLGGCDGLEAPVHERGVQVGGARITGVLDLEGCESKRDLLLVDCQIDATPQMIGARLASVILNRSAVPGLRADGLVTTGGVFLRGAKVTGAVRLLGAQIGGNLSCTGATLTGDATAKGPDAFGADASLRLWTRTGLSPRTGRLCPWPPKAVCFCAGPR